MLLCFLGMQLEMMTLNPLYDDYGFLVHKFSLIIITLVLRNYILHDQFLWGWNWKSTYLAILKVSHILQEIIYEDFYQRCHLFGNLLNDPCTSRFVSLIYGERKQWIEKMLVYQLITRLNWVASLDRAYYAFWHTKACEILFMLPLL